MQWVKGAVLLCERAAVPRALQTAALAACSPLPPLSPGPAGGPAKEVWAGAWGTGCAALGSEVAVPAWDRSARVLRSVGWEGVKLSCPRGTWSYSSGASFKRMARREEDATGNTVHPCKALRTVNPEPWNHPPSSSSVPPSLLWCLPGGWQWTGAPRSGSCWDS